MKIINQRWAAPEILEGRDYAVESDIYSMGLAFWETRYRDLSYIHVFFFFFFVLFSLFLFLFLFLFLLMCIFSHLDIFRSKILRIQSKSKY